MVHLQDVWIYSLKIALSKGRELFIPNFFHAGGSLYMIGFFSKTSLKDHLHPSFLVNYNTQDSGQE